MATLAGLILEVEEMLYGMAQLERPREDTLAGAIADGNATSMTVTTDTMWQRGDYAEIADTAGAVGEIVIAAADGSGGTVTIRRGQRGSTAAAQPNGAVLRKNPLFPRIAIQRAIEDVVDNKLYPHVYFLSHRTLTWVDEDWLYNLDADDLEVLDIYQVIDDNYWPFPRGWWDVVTSLNSAVATNSVALRLRRIQDDAETVYYTAKTRPSTSDYASIPNEIANLIPWGACAHLVGGYRASPTRYDPNRQALPETQESGPARDWRFFEQTFRLQRDELRRTLRHRVRHVDKKAFVRRRAWTG